MTLTSGGKMGVGTVSPDSKVHIESTDSRGHQNLLELKHPNTTTTGDGPALLLNGRYSNNAWQFAKISADNSGTGYGAKLKFWVHPANGTQGANVVEAMEINGDGSGANVKVTNGNLVIGTAGHGIDFSAFATSGNPSSNLLDDYEEGTWTPILYAWNGVLDQSYDTQTGNYIKIGNQVIANFFIDFSSKGTVSGNYTFIAGLPYIHAGTCAGTMVCWGWAMANSSIGWLAGDISSTNTVCWLSYHDGSNNNTNYLPASMLYDNSQIKGTLIYRAA